MTLLKFGEFLKPQKHESKIYPAKVVFNNDPLKLCRVKVIIEEFMTGYSVFSSSARIGQDLIDCLPWVTPFNNISAFGRSQIIPEIDDIVAVSFPYNDPHFPFYDVSEFINEDTALAKSNSSVFDVDYPHTVGYKDSTGTYLAINKKEKYVDFKHNSGFRIQIDKDGQCDITVPDDLNVTVNKTTDFHSVEKIMMYSDDKIELNKPAILPSARKTDEVTYICPIFGVSAKGIITSGNSKIIENM